MAATLLEQELAALKAARDDAAAAGG